jgi:HD-GYP domain-containing protein (c-di-GMP phosphodiesterase class II)
MLDTLVKSTGLSPHIKHLKSFGERLNKFGVNFALCDAEGELVLLQQADRFESDRQQLTEYALQVLEKDKGQTPIVIEDGILRLGRTKPVLAAVLKSAEQVVGTALVDLGNSSAQYRMRDELLSQMLALLAENFQIQTQAEKQIEMVGTELARVYEELVLLHKLSMNMKVTEPDANFLQMACDSLTGIVSVEGIAILLEKVVEDQRKLVLAAGSGLIDIDEHTAAVLYSRLVEEINSGREALLDSEVDSPFRYEWPTTIKNIIAVPLCGKDKAENKGSVIGLMVAINRIDKPDFDSTDVKLFNSVANGCGVFVENGRLFQDLKELFIGSLKALTSSIDAKDPYTRGHSERVAFISKWIAERLTEQESLDQEQIHKIYLAGLLHDIGKVGTDEAVLRKKGSLTKRELEHLRTHPSTGASILGEIKQMRDIVPGVLYHHERVDGKGYPRGLVGSQIPLIGKVVGLADSFDAMTSKRTYRDALTVEEAVAEIEKGLGTQFDRFCC